jgi:hypothetical protein
LNGPNPASLRRLIFMGFSSLGDLA